MKTTRHLLFLLLAAGLVPTSYAVLGESAAKIRERFGKPMPQVHNDPTSQVWLFEGEDGQLVYSVTLDAKGISIAEGLKPLKLAKFPRATVQDFIDGQLAPYRGSKTVLTPKAGEKYTFGGKVFVCGDHESIVVDDPNRILIIWSTGGAPSVIAVRPELFH